MRNWTQKELAEKLAVAEQQVQRYEATQYKGVSVERLQAEADALKLRVRDVITYAGVPRGLKSLFAPAVPTAAYQALESPPATRTAASRNARQSTTAD